VGVQGWYPTTGLPTRANKNSPKNWRLFNKNPQNIIIHLKFPKGHFWKVVGPLKYPKMATLPYACWISHHLQCEYGAHFLARVNKSSSAVTSNAFLVYTMNSNITLGMWNLIYNTANASTQQNVTKILKPQAGPKKVLSYVLKSSKHPLKLMRLSLLKLIYNQLLYTSDKVKFTFGLLVFAPIKTVT
jgi:hypothetical protein